MSSPQKSHVDNIGSFYSQTVLHGKLSWTEPITAASQLLQTSGKDSASNHAFPIKDSASAEIKLSKTPKVAVTGEHYGLSKNDLKA